MRVGLDAKLLTDKLPKFADTVKRDPDAPVNERASAAYFGKDYTEAERLFLKRRRSKKPVRRDNFCSSKRCN